LNRRAFGNVYAVIIIIAIAAIAAGACFLSGVMSPPAPGTGEGTVIDMAGRVVQVPAPVQRVVVIGSYWTEIACVLDCGERIVGIDKYTRDSVFVPESVRSQTVVGDLFRGINIETLVALKPDLVITDYGYGSSQDLVASLERLNISVVAISSQSMADQLRAIRIIGGALGTEARAEELADYLESRHSAVLSRASSIPDSEKPRVLICSLDVWSEGKIYVYANSVWGKAVEDVGGINLALRDSPGQQSYQVAFERILAWNPDIIVVVSRDSEALSKLNLTGALWDELDAVRSGSVFKLLIGYKDPGAYLDWGPRMVIGEMQLAEIIQPSRFSDLDWGSEASALLDRFYRR